MRRVVALAASAVAAHSTRARLRGGLALAELDRAPSRRGPTAAALTSLGGGELVVPIYVWQTDGEGEA